VLRKSATTRKQGYSIGFVVLGLILIFGASQALAVWSDPDQAAPNSTTAPPLIVGNPENLSDPINSLMQKKDGRLEVTGLMSVFGPTTTTQVNASKNVKINGELCLNGECLTNWLQVEGYVHLYDYNNGGFASAPDIGSFGVESASADVNSSSRIIPPAGNYYPFSVKGDALEPDLTTETVGIVGQSYGNEDALANSYGIGGNADRSAYCVGGTNPGAACLVNPCTGGGICQGVVNSAGVLGSNGGFSNAWAGKFDARIGIEGELCINESCRTKANIIETSPYDEYVRVQQDSEPISQIGIVQVEGGYQGGILVLGEPTTVTSVLITCGDGVCDYGANGENLLTCSADCT